MAVTVLRYGDIRYGGWPEGGGGWRAVGSGRPFTPSLPGVAGSVAPSRTAAGSVAPALVVLES